jgi:hypothetical protein
MGMARDKMEFAAAMAKHAPKATQWYLERLMRYGATVKRFAELACNRELTKAEILRDENAQATIIRLCCEIDCEAKFGGDPRGCTVKIIVPDGYTNDFGQEGVCVPTA